MGGSRNEYRFLATHEKKDMENWYSDYTSDADDCASVTESEDKSELFHFGVSGDTCYVQKEKPAPNQNSPMEKLENGKRTIHGGTAPPTGLAGTSIQTRQTKSAFTCTKKKPRIPKHAPFSRTHICINDASDGTLYRTLEDCKDEVSRGYMGMHHPTNQKPNRGHCRMMNWSSVRGCT